MNAVSLDLHTPWFTTAVLKNISGCRKLKCSGDPQGCTRCLKEHITCSYWEKKRMGRPRKLVGNGKSASSVARIASNVQGCSQGLNDSQTLTPLPSMEVPPTEASCPKATFPDLAHFLDPPLLPAQLLGKSTTEAMCNAKDIGGSFLHLTVPQLPLTVPVEENDTASCPCLAAMYLSAADLDISKLQGFPLALASIKKALSTAQTMVTCEDCCKYVGLARRNVLLLINLLASITMAFGALLRRIGSDARTAETQGQRKSLTVGGCSMSNRLGEISCDEVVTIDMSGIEWKSVIDKFVRRYIRDDSEEPLTLEGVLRLMEQRQNWWHSALFCEGAAAQGGQRQQPREICLDLANQVRDLVKQLP